MIKKLLFWTFIINSIQALCLYSCVCANVPGLVYVGDYQIANDYFSTYISRYYCHTYFGTNKKGTADWDCAVIKQYNSGKSKQKGIHYSWERFEYRLSDVSGHFIDFRITHISNFDNNGKLIRKT